MARPMQSSCRLAAREESPGAPPLSLMARSWLMTSTVAPRSAARLRRLDLRVVIGLALLLAGMVGTVGMVQRAGQRTPCS
jgi:hypothetical protein